MYKSSVSAGMDRVSEYFFFFTIFPPIFLFLVTVTGFCCFIFLSTKGVCGLVFFFSKVVSYRYHPTRSGKQEFIRRLEELKGCL